MPTDYESITPFVDLVLTDGTNVEYTTEGTIKATVKVEPAKNLKAEDLVLMQVDPATGVIYFIEIDEYDPETGAITAEFPVLGPFMVLEKSEAIAAAAAAQTEAATEAATEVAAE